MSLNDIEIGNVYRLKLPITEEKCKDLITFCNKAITPIEFQEYKKQETDIEDEDE